MARPFKSIKDLIKRVDLNAKAADCLGLSGALNNIEDCNESEAAQLAKGWLSYKRDNKTYLDRVERLEKREEVRIKKWEEKVTEKNKKNQIKILEHEEKLEKYRTKIEEIEEKNEDLISRGKKPRVIPEPPKAPKLLKIPQRPKPLERPSKPNRPIKPDLEMTQKERLALQREMLYSFISGHPLDSVKVPEGVSFIEDIKTLDESKSGQKRKIWGVLTHIKPIQTRRGPLMCSLQVEDRTGGIEIRLPPGIYKRERDNLEKWELYEVIGKVKITERETKDGDPYTHTQIDGKSLRQLSEKTDLAWEVLYPLFKGQLRISGSNEQDKGEVIKSLISKARKGIEVGRI